MELSKKDKWKCELADAILEEAKFNGVEINIGDDIDHQLGGVYIGRTLAGVSIIRTEKYISTNKK